MQTVATHIIGADKNSAAVIGGGPAGLMAAETLAEKGYSVTVFEQKPSPARKFLLAGRGGLNITHSEPLPDFMKRYGTAEKNLRAAVESFTPQDLRAWCAKLGEDTFIGTSGRVFPKSFKATPLLRAWQARLVSLGVTFRFQHAWQGWDEKGQLCFTNAHGTSVTAQADTTLLALGGASWPRMGSDGFWTKTLADKNISISPLRPANCGFICGWSEFFAQKYAGQPVKPVTASFDGNRVKGEIMISAQGIEGGAVYALSSGLRESLLKNKTTALSIDLRPDITRDALAQRLSIPRGAKSFANFLRTAGGLSPVAINLLRETEKEQEVDKTSPHALADLIKSAHIPVHDTYAIDRAISTAGGIIFDEVDEGFMLKKIPGVFVAGEMLDWEAPTGGYLLQATFSTAVAAAKGMAKHMTSEDIKK